MEIPELPGITRFIPKILLAVTVTICDEVYKKIAYWLNNMGKKSITESLKYSNWCFIHSRAGMSTLFLVCELLLEDIVQKIDLYTVYISSLWEICGHDGLLFSFLCRELQASECLREQSYHQDGLCESRSPSWCWIFLQRDKVFELLPCPVVVLQFEFINSYLSLFYIGFYLKDMERLKEVFYKTTEV